MIRPPRPETLTVSLFPEQVRRIRQDAATRRVAVSAQVRDVLAAYYRAVDAGHFPPLTCLWADPEE